MKQRYQFYITGMLCLLLSLLLPMVPVSAAVTTTAEPAGEGGTVYVAGNPDWYPVEYYDPGTKHYAGIVPTLLDRVSEATGMTFTYICAGEEDQRDRLARNGQIELVSGCTPEDKLLKSKTAKHTVSLTIPGEDGEIQICLLFTSIASKDLIQSVENGLSSISAQELSDIAARCAAEPRSTAFPVWGIVLLCVLPALALAAGIVLFLWYQKRKRTEAESQWIDQVTGIGNKAYFIQCFENEIPDVCRELYCVAYIGFDFDWVTQQYGPEKAEEQLLFASRELFMSVRDNEYLGRVSGGGFAVARPTSGEAEVETWADELLSRLNRFTEGYGMDHRPVFSAGIYLLEPKDRDWETVLTNAEHGYALAVSSSTPYAFSSSEHLQIQTEKQQILSELRAALEQRQFRMFLQFIVLPGNIIDGAETLSRWEHPRKGLLHPGSYIELLEQENILDELDCYMLEKVCRQLAQWGSAALSSFNLSYNVSLASLERQDFPDRLEEIMSRYDFQRSRLILEVPEQVLDRKQTQSLGTLARCRALGVRIALDNFDEAAFDAIQEKLPFDIIKISRTVLNAAATEQGAATLQDMIVTAHDYKVEVLCCGVETAAQADRLRAFGCDYLQGYHFCRPLPPMEAARFLRPHTDLVSEVHQMKQRPSKSADVAGTKGYGKQ